MQPQLSNINRFSETRAQAQINSRKELDNAIPLVPKYHFQKDNWERVLLRKLKREALFDMAALLGEKMYRGIRPSLEARYKKEYQQVITLC